MFGRGVMLPASAKNIIKDLFENEKMTYSNYSKLYTFSKLSLTTTQQNTLSALYPSGFMPENYFILYQIDTIDSTGVVTSTALRMVSFLEKTVRDGFIYGYYFDITGQSRFEIEYLSDSHCSIELVSGAIFTPRNYMEVYNDIHDLTVILGVDLDDSFASLQYAHNDHYYVEDLKVTGVVDVSIPKIKLTGLSKNLKGQP
jgi:hypothetical protein